MARTEEADVRLMEKELALRKLEAELMEKQKEILAMELRLLKAKERNRQLLRPNRLQKPNKAKKLMNQR